MDHSGYSDTVNQMLDRLNRPLFLVALALLLFLAHFSLVSYSLDLFSPYNFNGM